MILVLIQWHHLLTMMELQETLDVELLKKVETGELKMQTVSSWDIISILLEFQDIIRPKPLIAMHLILDFFCMLVDL